ncbi:17442_t:CDS:2 [Gigaspora margarita]|uniref:17442_t:CDS:1 n=1 Tax=Gigaspora margarita TaxID=4874 RepID=A0ABN7W8T3_GIGMA|nr:17442_t:CDS:2 [Gigaspora margarita]
MTLREFFYKIINKILSNASIDIEQIKKIKLSKSINPLTDTLQASPDCNITELTNEFRRNVHYCLSANELQSLFTTKLKTTITFRYCRMDSVAPKRLSTQTLTDNKGKQFIIALSDALWYINIRDRTKLQE